MHHSTSIANEFLKRAMRDCKDLTQMQLQKLVYIAHGWYLAIHNEPLVGQQPEAWDYGPVYPELWGALKHHGRLPVGKKIMKSDCLFWGFDDDQTDSEVVASLTEQEEELIDRVYKIYSDYRAYKLSALTHEDDTPWHKVYMQQGKKRGLIPNELIKEHFIELAQSGKR